MATEVAEKLIPKLKAEEDVSIETSNITIFPLAVNKVGRLQFIRSCVSEPRSKC